MYFFPNKKYISSEWIWDLRDIYWFLVFVYDLELIIDISNTTEFAIRNIMTPTPQHPNVTIDMWRSLKYLKSTKSAEGL